MCVSHVLLSERVMVCPGTTGFLTPASITPTMVDRMRRNLVRNSVTLNRRHSLTLATSAILLTLSGRLLHAQSLRPYSLSGIPERVAPAPVAPFRLEGYRPAPNIDASLTALVPLAPVPVNVQVWSRRAVPVSTQTAAAKGRALECPMPVARADSSHDRGMPVVRSDSAAARLDVGGSLVGCTNPLAR